jgi:hypothetical protein
MARADMCLGRHESDDHPVGPLALLSLSATSAINSRSPAVSSPSCSEDEPEALGRRGVCGAQAKLAARCRVCAASEFLVKAVAPPTGADETPKIGRVPTLLLGVGRNLGGW